MILSQEDRRPWAGGLPHDYHGRRAATMVATSIFVIDIIASKARLA